ncbi:MAG: transposase [Cetobacterium sp.]|nr:transposase [Cetobacterium sp.]MCJ8341919.1 transposase [Cetobacterium sp.]
MALSERVYKCDECGSQIDRDLNTSINIREAGKNIYQGRNYP